MKKIIPLLLLSSLVYSQTPNLLKLKQIERSPGVGYCIITNSLGVQTYTPCASLTSTVVPTLQQVVSSDRTVDGVLTQSTNSFVTVTVNPNSYNIRLDDGIDITEMNMSSNLFQFLGDLTVNGESVLTTTSTNTLTNKTYSNSILSGSVNVSGATANRLTYFDTNKDLKPVTLGSGLSLSSGTLTATGSGSTTILTASTNITVSGSAPNYTISTPTQTTGLATTAQLDLKQNVISGVIATGTNSYGATYSPTITLTTGLNILVTFTNANTTSVTLNANSTGTIEVVKGVSTSLVSGDIIANTPYLLMYNGTKYQIVGSNLTNRYIDYAPSHTGYSANPATVNARYALLDKMCTVTYDSGTGTSNATTTTITLPFQAKYLSRYVIYGTNSGTAVYAMLQTRSGSNIADLFLTAAGGAWTASGAKRGNFTITYEIN